MEKHRCKLCYRNFANGRALGGHMRSHMMNLYASSKPNKQEFKAEIEGGINGDHLFVSEEIESVPSFSYSSPSSSSDHEEQEDKGFFSYGVKTGGNFKRRDGMLDPDQLCFGGIEAYGSVVLQDRESETESSKNLTCRRFKRARKSRIPGSFQFPDCSSMQEFPHGKNPNSGIPAKSPSEFAPGLEAEPVSSIDTTPEEDVAHCLMMLSRDKWMREESEEDGEGFFPQEEELGKERKKKDRRSKKHYCHDFGVAKLTKSRTTGKYRCETCNKLFRSYQALGGHRASHKRIKVQSSNSTEEREMIEKAENMASAAAAAVSSLVEEKIHQCPFCFRVFPSGQALGGHKRSHVMGTAAAAATHVSNTKVVAPTKPFSRFGESFIDLNLPAPVDDDDASQIELSAVSDAEFVKPSKQ